MMTSKRWMAGIVAAGSLVFAVGGFAQSGGGSGDHQVHSGSDIHADLSEAGNAYREAATIMQHDMEQANTGDPDVDFATGMLAHHKGAVAMAQVELEYGNDPEMRALAQKIIEAQQAEIEQMQAWLKANADPAPVD
ncbi:DUF305 domain-containing protein [Salinicola sp. LHM]|jgi:uncharacterized protein (DUF305 family)|uniref:CopM family metallochaperone n=1 Tax=Salinicola sp. LHM TaxID=3065298 RepID=UPI002ACE8859|nr:DUF305 domain-containing protein [Salinicola sp. LHM]WQH33916.1 DUF305 domain-containing protein [Salinicola sp. LHM]